MGGPVETQVPLVMLNRDAIEDILHQWVEAQGFGADRYLEYTWIFASDGYPAGMRVDYYDGHDADD